MCSCLHWWVHQCLRWISLIITQRMIELCTHNTEKNVSLSISRSALCIAQHEYFAIIFRHGNMIPVPLALQKLISQMLTGKHTKKPLFIVYYYSSVRCSQENTPKSLYLLNITVPESEWLKSLDWRTGFSPSIPIAKWQNPQVFPPWHNRSDQDKRNCVHQKLQGGKKFSRRR